MATPVWFVRDGERLLVHTGADSYKVKRIRRNPSVLKPIRSIQAALGRVRRPVIPAITPSRASARRDA